MGSPPSSGFKVIELVHWSLSMQRHIHHREPPAAVAASAASASLEFATPSTPAYLFAPATLLNSQCARKNALIRSGVLSIRVLVPRHQVAVYYAAISVRGFPLFHLKLALLAGAMCVPSAWLMLSRREINGALQPRGILFPSVSIVINFTAGLIRGFPGATTVRGKQSRKEPRTIRRPLICTVLQIHRGRYYLSRSSCRCLWDLWRCEMFMEK